MVGSLPFLAMIIGILIAAAINLWGQNYYRVCFLAAGNKLVPEARLLPMIVGSIFFPTGLFIMGWTSSNDIHWIGCVPSVPSLDLEPNNPSLELML